jgi:purine-nucleoside phosphorylase
VRTGESTTPEERQQTFVEMVGIALEAVRLDVTGP